MAVGARGKKKDDPTMSGANDLRAELDALRQEVKALREARSKEERGSATARAEKKPTDAKRTKKGEPKPGIKDQLEELEQTLKDFAGDAEKEITARPIVSVAVAFFAGLVIGRLISR